MAESYTSFPSGPSSQGELMTSRKPAKVSQKMIERTLDGLVQLSTSAGKQPRTTGCRMSSGTDNGRYRLPPCLGCRGPRIPSACTEISSGSPLRGELLVASLSAD